MTEYRVYVFRPDRRFVGSALTEAGAVAKAVEWLGARTDEGFAYENKGEIWLNDRPWKRVSRKGVLSDLPKRPSL